MISAIIAILVFLVMGVVFIVFNGKLAKRFASAFFSISSWLLSSKFRRDDYYVVVYRVFFYAVSVFCIGNAIFGTVLVLSNIH